MKRKHIKRITGFVFTIACVLCVSATVFAADITIDLDYITEKPVNDRECAVDTNAKTITVKAPNYGTVLIKGDGTTNGEGWGIIIYDAYVVYIEDKTTILGSSGNNGLSVLLNEAEDYDYVTIIGGGFDISISSINSGAIRSNYEVVTLTGNLGDIKGGDRPEASFGGTGIFALNLNIAGKIGLIAGGMGEREGNAIVTANDGATNITGNASIKGGIQSNLSLWSGGTLNNMLGVSLFLNING
jgi:hypothetical protein